MKIALDAGHGGFKDYYRTDPKIGKLFKFPTWTFYEGVSNRNIAEKLIKKLDIEVVKTYHEFEDYSLNKRVQIANLSASDMFVSIHSNAGGGNGFEVFTTKGTTKSDSIAQIFCENLKKDFPEFPLRNDLSDGDLDRESDFYVIKNTKMPAVLLELLFFDDEKQALFLMSEEGQERIAESLKKSIELCRQLF